MSTIVRTQQELDEALAAGAEDIVIDSPAGVWLRVAGSASVRVVGSATVWASGAAVVWAWDSVTVRAGSHVAVHLHSRSATVDGGVLIDHTAVDLTDPAQWCDYHGLREVDAVGRPVETEVAAS